MILNPHDGLLDFSAPVPPPANLGAEITDTRTLTETCEMQAPVLNKIYLLNFLSLAAGGMGPRAGSGAQGLDQGPQGWVRGPRAGSGTPGLGQGPQGWVRGPQGWVRGPRDGSGVLRAEITQRRAEKFLLDFSSYSPILQSSSSSYQSFKNT